MATTPGGGTVKFSGDTLIARALWTTGAFEQREVSAAFRLSARDSYTFDIGANVGLFTVVMSRAVGPAGTVVAIEPVGETVRALRDNLERNECNNVEVFEGAAAASSGEVSLTLTDDPALHSAGGKVIAGHPILHRTTVQAYTIDEIWSAAGQPPVSLVKIDVEGGELGVIVGAARMIGQCRPALIVEVNDPGRLQSVTDALDRYRVEPSPGFEPWNHLMVPE